MIDYEIFGALQKTYFHLAFAKLIDHSFGKPIFAHIMTTSIPPYPKAGLIYLLIPVGVGKIYGLCNRKIYPGSRKKKWYSNTVFVITADHCASSAGRQLPIQVSNTTTHICTSIHYAGFWQQT
jgi:hypothetical protein